MNFVFGEETLGLGQEGTTVWNGPSGRKTVSLTLPCPFLSRLRWCFGGCDKSHLISRSWPGPNLLLHYFSAPCRPAGASINESIAPLTNGTGFIQDATYQNTLLYLHVGVLSRARHDEGGYVSSARPPCLLERPRGFQVSPRFVGETKVSRTGVSRLSLRVSRSVKVEGLCDSATQNVSQRRRQGTWARVSVRTRGRLLPRTGREASSWRVLSQ